MMAYLLDIEGTTTPIDFVHKVLFPYARERVDAYVKDHFETLRPEIVQLASEHRSDGTYTSGLESASPQSVAAYLTYLIDIDRKSTPLKSIQGKIWQAGYESGELRSQIFDDVPRAFERWTAAGKTIAIYSSGSVLAQKNLFKYTDHGDLTPFISDHFDTNVGAKRESESYARIASALGFEASEILFVSDVAEELDAAKLSGFQTVLSMRPGNAEIAGTVA
ncbi:MAG: acireductone synthase, partial [Pyrinomonadaceae bacterium]